MSKKRVGPKRRKGGSGMIGMGRGDLAQGGGAITRKIPPPEVLQGQRDKIGVKTILTDRAAASFASRARAAKIRKSEESS